MTARLFRDRDDPTARASPRGEAPAAWCSPQPAVGAAQPVVAGLAERLRTCDAAHPAGLTRPCPRNGPASSMSSDSSISSISSADAAGPPGGGPRGQPSSASRTRRCPIDPLERRQRRRSEVAGILRTGAKTADRRGEPDLLGARCDALLAGRRGRPAHPKPRRSEVDLHMHRPGLPARFAATACIRWCMCRSTGPSRHHRWRRSRSTRTGFARRSRSRLARLMAAKQERSRRQRGWRQR